MKFKGLFLSSLLLLTACDTSSETRHQLSSLSFRSGDTASLNIFGRVVEGSRNQAIVFQTGVVPIPFVQTKDGIVNLDVIRAFSASEHGGRALGGYLRARTRNMVDRSPTERVDDISLTELKKSRRVRTAIAQFPTLSDFKPLNFVRAIFTSDAQTSDANAVYYDVQSAEASVLSDALGRPIRFPVLFDQDNLIEGVK